MRVRGVYPLPEGAVELPTLLGDMKVTYSAYTVDEQGNKLLIDAIVGGLLYHAWRRFRAIDCVVRTVSRIMEEAAKIEGVSLDEVPDWEKDMHLDAGIVGLAMLKDLKLIE